MINRKKYAFMDFGINHIPCDFFTNNHYKFYTTGTHQEHDNIETETFEQKLDILRRLVDGENLYLWANEYHYNIENRRIPGKTITLGKTT